MPAERLQGLLIGYLDAACAVCCYLRVQPLKGTLPLCDRSTGELGNVMPAVFERFFKGILNCANEARYQAREMDIRQGYSVHPAGEADHPVAQTSFLRYVGRAENLN
jgi:hypothetical protein